MIASIVRRAAPEWSGVCKPKAGALGLAALPWSSLQLIALSTLNRDKSHLSVHLAPCHLPAVDLTSTGNLVLQQLSRNSVPMERYAPYYADDTQGVHFEVGVDGAYVQAHVSRHVLTSRYGLPADFREWVDAYRTHQEEINASVLRTAKAFGRTIVILQLKDLERWSR